MATSDVISNDGFDQNYYLAEKAAQLTQSTGQTWTVAQVQQAFQAAGLTAQEHYYEYGYAEGLSPNAYYNDDQYAASKAAEAGMTTDAFRLAWYNASGSTNLYTHYLQYGAFESGVNPSTGFNDDAYYQAKAAHDGTTVAAAKSAIQSAGLTAVSHYLLYGQNEGLNFSPTPAEVPQTLTLNADNLSGTAFSAPLLINTDGTMYQSLQTVDTLTGSGATSVLNATLNGRDIMGSVNATPMPTIPMPTMTNVGTVNLTSAPVAGGATLDALLTHGTTAWGDVNSTSDLTINHIQDVPTAINLKNIVNDGTASSNFTANIAADATASTNGHLALSLDGVTNTSAQQHSTININDATNSLTTYDINTTGHSSWLTQLTDTSGVQHVSTINITGDQALTIANGAGLVTSTNALDASVTTVNAQALTGNLTLGLNTALPASFVGGHGNDTITFFHAQDVTAAGNDGNDTFLFQDSHHVTATGGTGDDTFTLHNAVTNTATATLDGGTGNDHFTFINDVANGLWTATATGGDGNDVFNVINAAGQYTFDGGTGNDVFQFGTHLDGLSSINGGTGTDILQADISGQTVSNLQIQNVEHLDLAAVTTANAPGANLIDLTGVTGIDTLFMGQSSNAVDETHSATVDHAGSSIGTVNFAPGENADGTLIAGTDANHYYSGLTFADSYSGSSDSLTLNINNGGTALTSGHTLGVGDLDLSGAEHVAINVTDGTAQVGNVIGGTLSDLTLHASGDLTTGNISSITTYSTANTIHSIDATGVTGDLTTGTITGLANGATITLGNATNAITAAESSSNSVSTVDSVNIIGGSGADSITVNGNASAAHGWNTFITGGAGADTIDLSGNMTGAGASGSVDTLNYTHITDSLISTGMDTVKDFVTGTDKFDVSATQYTAIHSTDGLTTNSLTTGTGNLGQDLSTAIDQQAGHNSMIADGASVVTIGSGADAGVYLVLNDHTAAFDASTDAVIHLTGATTALAVSDFV